MKRTFVASTQLILERERLSESKTLTSLPRGPHGPILWLALLLC